MTVQASVRLRLWLAWLRLAWGSFIIDGVASYAWLVLSTGTTTMACKSK